MNPWVFFTLARYCNQMDWDFLQHPEQDLDKLKILVHYTMREDRTLLEQLALSDAFWSSLYQHLQPSFSAKDVEALNLEWITSLLELIRNLCAGCPVYQQKVLSFLFI